MRPPNWSWAQRWDGHTPTGHLLPPNQQYQTSNFPTGFNPTLFHTCIETSNIFISRSPFIIRSSGQFCSYSECSSSVWGISIKPTIMQNSNVGGKLLELISQYQFLKTRVCVQKYMYKILTKNANTIINVFRKQQMLCTKLMDNDNICTHLLYLEKKTLFCCERPDIYHLFVV